MRKSIKNELTEADEKVFKELERARKLYDNYINLTSPSTLDELSWQPDTWPHRIDLPLSLTIKRD